MSKRRNERVSNGWRRRQLRARVLAAYDVCAICGKPVDKTLKTPHPMNSYQSHEAAIHTASLTAGSRTADATG